MIDQTLNSWDVEDDDINQNENMVFDEKTGLYKKTRQTYNDKDQLCQEILEYKLETFTVSETVKARKLLKKFGKSKYDAPGPNPAQTYLGDEILLKYFTDEIAPVEEEKKATVASVKCRNCQGDHFSHKCPYKDEIKNIQELTDQLEAIAVDQKKPNTDDSTKPDGIAKASINGSYVPPHMRDNAPRVFNDKKRPDSAMTIRVSNLPETAQENDLEDLFRPFGSLSRTFLVKDRVTGVSRGAAYVTFHSRSDAAKAIEAVNGFGYDHCILQVQWSDS